MSQFEYRVIPTPRRPKRAKGVKGEPARFANVLTEAINEIAVDGWEFYKTETLPMDAKPGFFSRRIEMSQSVMVFRRVIAVSQITEQTEPAPARATPPLVATREEPRQVPAFVEEEGPRAASSDPVPEAVAEPEDEDVVTFDRDNIDPLKRAVDGSRASE